MRTDSNLTDTGLAYIERATSAPDRPKPKRRPYKKPSIKPSPPPLSKDIYLWGAELLVPHLKPAALRVIHALIWHANKRTGQCDPSYETLAREWGLTPSVVHEGSKELSRRGIIGKWRRVGKSSSTAINWALLESHYRKKDPDLLIRKETKPKTKSKPGQESWRKVLEEPKKKPWERVFDTD